MSALVCTSSFFPLSVSVACWFENAEGILKLQIQFYPKAPKDVFQAVSDYFELIYFFLSCRQHSELLVFLTWFQHARSGQSGCSLHHSHQWYPLSPVLIHIWDEDVSYILLFIFCNMYRNQPICVSTSLYFIFPSALEKINKFKCVYWFWWPAWKTCTILHAYIPCCQCDLHPIQKAGFLSGCIYLPKNS